MRRISPEKTQAWSFALFPGVVLVLTVFMIATKQEITTNTIGLFVGLITAGTLQIAVKKRDSNVDRDSDSHSDNPIHKSRSSKLEETDRSGTNNFNRRVLGLAWFYRL